MDVGAEISRIEEEQKNISEDMTRYRDEVSAGKIVSDEKSEELREKRRQIGLKIVNTEAENEKLIIHTILLFAVYGLGVFATFSSFAWIYSGFSDWQSKLQNYHDEIVKNQAKENIKTDSDKSLIIKPNE